MTTLSRYAVCGKQGATDLVGFATQHSVSEFSGRCGKRLRRWTCGRFVRGFVLGFLIVIFYVFIGAFCFVIVIAETRVVVVDGGEGAQKETADLGEDGGAARRDATLGDEFVESAQGVVNALGTLKVEGVVG